jgi:hypothetical protein
VNGSPAKILPGMPIKIIEYPDGEAKRYATTNCRMLELRDDGFRRYETAGSGKSIMTQAPRVRLCDRDPNQANSITASGAMCRTNRSDTWPRQSATQSACSILSTEGCHTWVHCAEGQGRAAIPRPTNTGPSAVGHLPQKGIGCDDPKNATIVHNDCRGGGVSGCRRLPSQRSGRLQDIATGALGRLSALS